MTSETLIGVHMLFNNASVEELYSTPHDAMKAQIDAAAELGVDVIRFPGDWRALQSEGPGTVNEWYVDTVLEMLAHAKELGVQVNMLFAQTPFWAIADQTLDPNSQEAIWQAPANPDAFGEGAALLYGRIADAGLSDVVEGWELWNEPNAVDFWPTADIREGTDVQVELSAAAEYVDLLNAGYDALKMAAAGHGEEVTVIGGSLAGADADYLQAMYDAGAKFDTLAIHPYTKADVRDPNGHQYAPDEMDPNDPLAATWSFEYGIQNIRDVMLANGDADADVWLTEFGWTSNDSWGGAGSEAAQAAYTETALDLLAKFDFVTQATIFRLYDKDGDGAGLYREDGSLKPVGEVFANHQDGPAPFAIDGLSTEWGWGLTEDGEGVVTWNGDDYHILEANTEIVFNDKVVDTDYLFEEFEPTQQDNVVAIDDHSSAWGWGLTEDGNGIVAWKGAEFHIFDANVQIQFNDVTVDTSELFTTPEPTVSEFVIEDQSSNWGWGKTEDGAGVVVWKGAEFHILDAETDIRFADKLIDTSYLFDQDGVFEIDDQSSNWDWGLTEDGQGVVAWSGADYFIMDANTDIQFEDTLIETDYLFA